MERRPRLAALLAVAVVLAVTGAAIAADARAEVGDAEKPASSLTRSFEPMKVLGMQVYIDPETGQMRTPTPEEAAALAAQMQQMFGLQAASQPTVVEHRDGMLSAELDPAMMDFAVVRIAPDGTKVFDCVDDARAAAALATTPTPANPGPGEE